MVGAGEAWITELDDDALAELVAALGREGRDGRRRAFGTTWWGKAWTDALQRRARLDENRLPRGRTYARHDRVQEIELSPGEINARVQGSRPEPYTVRIHIRRFTDDEWNVVLDAVTARGRPHCGAARRRARPGDRRGRPGRRRRAPAHGRRDRAPLLVSRPGDPLQALSRRLLPRRRRAGRRSLRRSCACGVGPGRRSWPSCAAAGPRGRPARRTPSGSAVLMPPTQAPGHRGLAPCRGPAAPSPQPALGPRTSCALGRGPPGRRPLHRRGPPDPGRRRRRTGLAHDQRRRPLRPGGGRRAVGLEERQRRTNGGLVRRVRVIGLEE